MSSRVIRTHCKLDAGSRAMLEHAAEKFGLSARAYFRIIKIARTIADLAGQNNIDAHHLSEAIQYRMLDRSTQELS